MKEPFLPTTRRKRPLKVLGVVLIILSVGLSYWLISPVFRETFLDEPLPSFGDAMDSMSDSTRTEFERQVNELHGTGSSRNEMMPYQSVIISTGDMQPRAHAVSGRALIIDTGDRKVLRFENLDTVNGPDLRIYLSKDLSNDESIDLGAIRATNGNVNYGLPSDVDLSEYRYALIWCRAFSVIFSYAELR